MTEMTDKTQILDNLLGEITKDINNLRNGDLGNIYYARRMSMDRHDVQSQRTRVYLYMMVDIKTSKRVRESVRPGDLAMGDYADIYKCTYVKDVVVQNLSSDYIEAAAIASASATFHGERHPVWEMMISEKHLLGQFEGLISLLARADRAYKGRLDTQGHPEEAKRIDEPDNDKIRDFEDIEVS